MKSGLCASVFRTTVVYYPADWAPNGGLSQLTPKPADLTKRTLTWNGRRGKCPTKACYVLARTSGPSVLSWARGDKYISRRNHRKKGGTNTHGLQRLCTSGRRMGNVRVTSRISHQTVWVDNSQGWTWIGGSIGKSPELGTEISVSVTINIFKFVIVGNLK